MTIRVEDVRRGWAFDRVVLREADALECAAGGMTSAEALKMSAEGSLEAWAVYVDDVLCAVWGYSAGLVSHTAHAWLLTTPEVERHRIRFLRSSLRIVAHLLERYPSVMVMVHRPYTKAVVWLSWLKFNYVSSNNQFILMERRR